MNNSTEPSHSIENIFRISIRNSIFNQDAVELNRFIPKLNFKTKYAILEFVVSKKSPFSYIDYSSVGIYFCERIKFNSIKAYNILNIKKKMRNYPLSNEHVSKLWELMAKKIDKNHNILRLLGQHIIFEIEEDLSYSFTPDPSKNNITKSLYGPAVNLEYGHLGIPSLKPSEYRLKKHRK